MFNNQMRIIYGADAELATAPPFSQNALVVDFNPSSYKKAYANKYSCAQGIHSAGTSMKYSRSSPDKISLTFLFDGTGVKDFGAVHAFNVLTGKADVKTKIEDFLKATTVPDGKTHEPQTLRLLWGDLDFRCKLTSVDINYKLFDGSGDPLRAELSAEFKRYFTEEEWKKLFNKQSPDVTHQRILKAGETLPMLCKQVYGKTKFYVDVAKANRISNFRSIKPGTKIIFPPLV